MKAQSPQKRLLVLSWPVCYSLTMHDLIIIGGGPAGLAAAAYAAERQLDYLLLSRDLGGKCNYLAGPVEMEDPSQVTAKDIVTIYKSKLECLRHSYRLETATSISHQGGVFSVTTDKGGADQSRAVLVATGAGTRRLDVPGELQYLSRGIGYSACSYSHLFRGKRVFLTGDSDRVLNSTIEMSIQAGSVVLSLPTDNECSRDLLDYVKTLGCVEVITDGVVMEFSGGDYATEVLVSTPDGERRFSADGFFVELETHGNSGLLKDVLKFHGAGYVPVDGSGMTAIPGLFAAGDVTDRSCCEHVLAALGQGASAMLCVYRYLRRLAAQSN